MSHGGADRLGTDPVHLALQSSVPLSWDCWVGLEGEWILWSLSFGSPVIGVSCGGGGGGGRRLVYVICLPPPCSLPGAGPRLSFSVSGRSPAGRERWLEDIHYNDNNSHATYHLLFAVAKWSIIALTITHDVTVIQIKQKQGNKGTLLANNIVSSWSLYKKVLGLIPRPLWVRCPTPLLFLQ